MKIDVTQQLKELDGTPLVLASRVCVQCGQTVEGQDYTLRLACTTALVAQFRDEELQGDEGVRRYQLAMRIYEEDRPNLTADDIVLTKKLVAKMRGPLVIGQVWEMLDPQEEKGDG